MHEGEIGKSRARALICWPVNQCSLEDLVNISWLSFAFSFQIPSPYSSSSSQQLKAKWNKNWKKKSNNTYHYTDTIQLLLSHATVRVTQLQKRYSFFLNPWECMSIWGRLKTIGQINLGCFWRLVFITYFVDI